MSEERLHDGSLYMTRDQELGAAQARYLDELFAFNQIRPSQTKLRDQMLHKMFAEIGTGCYFEGPLHANWGGHHVHFGSHIYANFNLTLVDDTHIYVGSYTQFGPNVVLATAGHPILPELRPLSYQYNAPIHIGTNCWLGAGVIVLPGVTIGNNTVVGAGAVVTRDLPANVVAVGNPAHVMRSIGDRDRETYFRGKPIDWDQVHRETNNRL
ncbi:sugar O-acetyltransferase [Lacticaseibacillus zhaodongensis]|uniref:sugar O-acetyltransferase n=1 Tax=Lacticaseibacillus zhaodongensis TaxID=2668065 RepID=UPI0012D357CD|nr:sugar O-acetyltransferase [Lacticaseibacillus zhaodongensis]